MELLYSWVPPDSGVGNTDRTQFTLTEDCGDGAGQGLGVSSMVNRCPRWCWCRAAVSLQTGSCTCRSSDRSSSTSETSHSANASYRRNETNGVLQNDRAVRYVLVHTIMGKCRLKRYTTTAASFYLYDAFDTFICVIYHQLINNFINTTYIYTKHFLIPLLKT